jgi:hypothetical protein
MRSTRQTKRRAAMNDLLANDLLANEEAAFRRKQAGLMRRYKGQFVALQKGAVIGHGWDDEELAARMFKKVGDAPFYIAKVENEPTVAELPSPELDRG